MRRALRASLSVLFLLPLGCEHEAPIAASPIEPPPVSVASVVSAPRPEPVIASASAPTPQSSSAPAVASAAPPASMSPLELSMTIPKEGSVTLEDGTIVTVTGNDHITIKAAKGGSESSCGDNGLPYRKAVEYMAELQLRLRAGDHAKVAEMINYPLRVNLGKKPLIVKDAAGLVRDYDKIFPAATTAKVLAANPRALFCRPEGVMLGDGVVWASVDAKQRYGASAINP